jgi:uncharacterized tellurite resistance protein B-like protein
MSNVRPEVLEACLEIPRAARAVQVLLKFAKSDPTKLLEELEQSLGWGVSDILGIAAEDLELAAHQIREIDEILWSSPAPPISSEPD